MKKQTFEHTCPCNDLQYKLVYESDYTVELYCPFCGVAIDDVNENLEEEVEYDYDD